MTHEALIAYSTVVLAVVTAVLAFFTYRLWSATTLLAKDAKETSTRIERAYVFVEVLLQGGLYHTPSGNLPTDIEVRIWNHGKTPAMLTKVRAFAAVLREPPKQLLPQPGSEKQLPPGLVIETHSSYPVAVIAHIADVTMGEMERAELALYCLGRVEYEDVFGRPQQTGFCWQYQLRGGERRFIIALDTPLNYRT